MRQKGCFEYIYSEVHNLASLLFSIDFDGILGQGEMARATKAMDSPGQ